MQLAVRCRTMTRMMMFAYAALFLVACSSEKPATAPAPAPTPASSAVPAPAATAVDALALRIVELEARVDRLEAIVRSHGEPGAAAMPADKGTARDPMSMESTGMGSAMRGMGNMDKVPMDKPMEHGAMGSSGSGSADPAPSNMGGAGHM